MPGARRIAVSYTKEFLRNKLPLIVFNNPLSEDEYLNRAPARKELLPGFSKRLELTLLKMSTIKLQLKCSPMKYRVK